MRIGIVGAGQLGQMLGNAASTLDVECVFLDPGDQPPASSCGTVIKANYDDAAALSKLANQCDVITYEFENVPVEALSELSGTVPIFPPLAALHYAQDRLHEKRLFAELNLPLADSTRLTRAPI